MPAPADGVWTIIATDVLVALILGVIAWGGSTGRLRANPIAGIRLGQSTPAQWRASHLAALPWFLASAVSAMLGASAAWLAVGLGSVQVASGLAYAGLGLAAVGAILGTRSAAHAITATRRAEDRVHGSHG